jgi:CRP-like cAMP-binding protein
MSKECAMAQKIDGGSSSSSLPIVNSHSVATLNKALLESGIQRPFLHSERPVRIAGLYGHNPHQNHILAALPFADYERFSSHLELISMPFGLTLCEAGCAIQHVYFPTSSIVSMLHDTKDGASAETAVIGNEGVVGIARCMGGECMSCRAVVKSAGYGFRLRASVLQSEFDRGGALQNHLLRYTQALLTQLSQTAVCNRHHSVAQQLCRWLLLCIDRLPSNELSMTQELIANMLGVRRESVAEAASKLQDENLIHYRRGHITILDRFGLERRVCECYANVKREYDRLLPTKVEKIASGSGK